MRPDAAVLADLAASIADGHAIDWSSAEAAVPSREQRLVRHLRLVESIASLYRSIPEEDSDRPITGSLRAGTRWGRLTIQESIGEGTSCEVFRAFDVDLQREVALKLLHPDGSHHETHTRVLEEARRLARVRHPHVVQVYGAERHDDRVGLWMELVRGESLEQTIKTRGTFGAREAATIGQDVCSALAAVHAAGLLHRDIKAQNVLRENGGRIVLMDFGTGEEIRREPGTPRLVGTPLYLAPEILRGHAASVQADVYAIGVLLFYLVTGEFPIAAATMEHLARAHANGTIRRLRDVRPDLPAPFFQVFNPPLDPDAASRYATAGEMEAALRETPARPGAVPAAPAPSTANALRVILPVLAVAIIAVALIVWNRGRTSGVPLTSFQRLAVLPVETGPGTASTLSSDMTSALISTLGRITTLRVTSAASVQPYRSAGQSIPQIAAALGVDGVLVPSLTLAADGSSSGELRVRLLAGEDGREVWAETFTHPLTAAPSALTPAEDVRFQTGLAREVAEALRKAISPGGPVRFGQQPSGNPDAMRAFALGSEHLRHLSVERGRLAIQAFTRAVTLDPTYAAAHAALARSYIELGFLGATTQAEARAEGLAAANRAIAADGDSSDAYAAVGDLKFFYDWDFVGAEEAYSRAIELNPSASDPQLAFARYLSAMGRVDDAIKQTDRAKLSDPLGASPHSIGGLTRYFKGDYDGALESVNAAVGMNPAAAGVFYVRGRIQLARRDFVHALQDTDRAIELAGTPSENWKLQRILVLALSGQQAEARDGLARYITSIGGAGAIPPQSLVHVGLIRDALGDRAGALDAFDRAVLARDPNVLWASVDPRMAALRTDARFQAAMARIGLTR